MAENSAGADAAAICNAADDRPIGYYKKMYERASSLGKIGVWECDLATEALTWTDTVYDLFDLPKSATPSRTTTLALYEPESRREMEARRAEAIANCSTFSVDVAIHTVLGNSRWIRITGDVELEHGRAVRIYGTKQDITAEKEAQLQIAALQTSLIHRSRESAIDAMRSTLAHELNQPLAAIAAYVGALQNALKSDLLDAAATTEILSAIEMCTSRAGRILRDAGRLPATWQRKPSTFDLSSAVRDACQLALADAPASLKITYALRSGLHGFGDPIQIQQVVIILARNAREAMEGLEREEIEITTTENAGCAEVSISDCGAGISDDVRGSIFDAFVTTKPGGTGIGLSIARTIVEAHGGKLTAKNNPAGGATFCFSIPVGPDD